ncbi:MAG: RNA-binding protein [Rhizomicrobium sp.]
MSLAAAIRDEDDEAMRDRRCIVSGEVLPDDKLVRFVVSPDGEVTPDVAASLPGRGIWVGAAAATLGIAVKKNLFAKAARAQVKVAPDLVARVEGLLVARMQADLGLARRSGVLLTGFDSVTRAIQSDAPPALLVEARDGAPDGKRKVFAAAHALRLKIETVACLTSAEISVAVGRENVIHAALKSGRLQERLQHDARRLSGFRPVPAAADERDE